MRVGVVVALSLLLGGLTSYAQGFLPSAVASFANSASGWTLITVVLVFWSRVRPGGAALLGASSFVLLVLGYTVAAGMRGYTYHPTTFLVVAVVAGPVVGVASSWLRAAPVRAAIGTAVLAGIGIGETVYGLTVIGSTTAATYWVAIGTVASALLVGMVAVRVRDTLPATLAVAGTAVAATAFVLAYSQLGAIG